MSNVIALSRIEELHQLVEDCVQRVVYFSDKSAILETASEQDASKCLELLKQQYSPYSVQVTDSWLVIAHF